MGQERLRERELSAALIETPEKNPHPSSFCPNLLFAFAEQALQDALHALRFLSELRGFLLRLAGRGERFFAKV